MTAEKDTQDTSQPLFYLDPSIKTPEERTEYVRELIEKIPPNELTPQMVNSMDEYIFYAISKEERKEKKILTNNHMVTVNKRELSFEGLVSKFENGEDGIYSMIANDKNIIFMPKVEITKEDVKEIPGMKELQDAIKVVDEQAKKATGRKKYLLIKQSIEMKKQQYILRNSYRRPIYFLNATKSINRISFDEKIWLEKNAKGEMEIKTEGFSMLNPEHVSILLCHYSSMKEHSYGQFDSDSYYMIIDLEDLIERSLPEENPIYYKILIYKIDGETNASISEKIYEEFGKKYADEYISSIWRQKIPKALATQAQKEWLIWYYSNKEYGKWKRCSRCGEIKLAHSFFFSKNGTSKDGWYSLCKDCRRKKNKK